jgi:hypothetical protein
MPMSIIMTGLNIAYIIHMSTEFLDYFMEGYQPWPHFQDSCPHIIPHKLAFGDPCTFVHAVHRPTLLQLL